MKIRIKEARSHYEATTGLRMTQKRLAELVFGEEGVNILTAMDRLFRMQRGAINPNIEVIERIGLITGVTYDFLINDN